MHGRRDGRNYFAAPVPVAAIDSVGAGDAFAAGYLATRLDGGDLHDCMNLAARVGAFAVTVHGDWEGLPTREELDHDHHDSVTR